jgi:hypothetical protein
MVRVNARYQWEDRDRDGVDQPLVSGCSLESFRCAANCGLGGNWNLINNLIRTKIYVV